MLVVLIITVLSVYPFSSGLNIPHFKFQDKLIHTFMYVALAFFLWYDTYSACNPTSGGRLLLSIILLFPTIYGGFIEIIQDLFFPPRTAEWLDWAADIVGSVIGFMLALFLLRKKWKKTNY
jgi:VanZ family protein